MSAARIYQYDGRTETLTVFVGPNTLALGGLEVEIRPHLEVEIRPHIGSTVSTLLDEVEVQVLHDALGAWLAGDAP